MVRHRAASKFGRSQPAKSTKCGLTYLPLPWVAEATALLIERPSDPWDDEHRAMSERELTGAVIRKAKGYGIELRFHPEISDDSKRGWPDWVLVGRRGILFWELKSYTGTVTAEQRDFILGMAWAGQGWKGMGAAVRWPCHLKDGTIDRELRAIAGVADPLVPAVPAGVEVRRSAVVYRPPADGFLAKAMGGPNPWSQPPG